MSYAISTVDGDHLGFILLDGGADLAGHCLIRLLPADSEHSDKEEAQYLSSLQGLGELRWERVSDEFQISGPDGTVLLVEKGGDMTGSGFRYLVIEVSQ